MQKAGVIGGLSSKGSAIVMGGPIEQSAPSKHMALSQCITDDRLQGGGEGQEEKKTEETRRDGSDEMTRRHLT